MRVSDSTHEAIEQLERLKFESSCNTAMALFVALATGMIECQFPSAAVVQALGETLRCVGAGILKERHDAQADNIGTIVGKLHKMLNVIGDDWNNAAMLTPSSEPVAGPLAPDPPVVREQPRRAQRQSVIGGKFAGAPTIRVPGIDVPLPLLTKGFLVDQTDGEGGDTLHLSGCGGPELFGFYDVDSGLVILQCADCGRYVGGIRVASES